MVEPVVKVTRVIHTNMFADPIRVDLEILVTHIARDMFMADRAGKVVRAVMAMVETYTTVWGT